MFGQDHRRGDPLLGELLGLPVERRDDLVAARRDGLLAAEDAHQLLLHLPREVRGAEGVRLVADEDHRLLERLRELGRRKARPAAAGAGSLRM